MFFFHRKEVSPAESSMAMAVPTTVTDSLYVLPKGVSAEDERLDFQHYLMRSLLKGHYRAPYMSPRRILDVGTGTARWAHDVAHVLPNAQVIGIDQELPATLLVMPKNYSFVQCNIGNPAKHVEFVAEAACSRLIPRAFPDCRNIIAGLPFEDDAFDFTHQRFLVLALPALLWPVILEQLVRVTIRGGFIELVEGGGAFHNVGPVTKQLQEWWKVASKVKGIDVDLMSHLTPIMQKAGMHHISSEKFRVPVGGWGGRIGTMVEQNILSSMPGIKTFVCQHAHVDSHEFDTAVSELPTEWKKQRTTYEYYDYYGQVK